MPINCGAIPTELMESEFFGHKKGSFTGAVADKVGLVQTAEGGTLFLDEVADLPLHMQVKLLRVIQEKTIRPIGQATELPVDVRILSATHKDLSELVAEGSFREDLFYRINVIGLVVPPLRERGDDVLLLAHHTLKRLPEAKDVPTPHLTRAAQAALLLYQVPGQRARAREHPRTRAHAYARGEEIDVDDLQLREEQEADFRRGARLAARHAARRDRARRDRQSARADALQQDGGREASRHHVPGAALSHQEARHRVSLKAAVAGQPNAPDKFGQIVTYMRLFDPPRSGAICRTHHTRTRFGVL